MIVSCINISTALNLVHIAALGHSDTYTTRPDDNFVSLLRLPARSVNKTSPKTGHTLEAKLSSGCKDKGSENAGVIQQ